MIALPAENFFSNCNFFPLEMSSNFSCGLVEDRKLKEKHFALISLPLKACFLTKFQEIDDENNFILTIELLFLIKN